MKKLLLISLVLLSLLSDITYGQSSKAYILSEGGFSAGSSKLSLYNFTSNTFTQSIFNPGNLGLYPDGLIFYNNYLYLIEQGNYGTQGKIYKLDTNGTVQTSVSFGTNPYSLAIANNKIYATNGPISKVVVLNLNGFGIAKEISVGVYPQEILSYNNTVFVCNTSLYGGSKDSTVSVINALTDSVVARITVRKDPSSLAISKDNKLLIGCPGSNGKIYKVDLTTYQKTDSISLSSGFAKDMAVDMNTGNIFYINYNNGISYCNFSTGQVNNVISNPNPAVNYFYGYNYDYTIGKHYITDAKNFTVSGSLYIYNSVYSLENTFTTGVAPRRIAFNNSGSIGIRQISEIVEGYSLHQNYPNPFNPNTIIKFSIHKTGFVSLIVYDVTGKEVAKLLNGVKKSGTYEVDFNGENLNSGVYFYKLTNSSFSDVKKMILIK